MDAGTLAMGADFVAVVVASEISLDLISEVKFSVATGDMGLS